MSERHNDEATKSEREGFEVTELAANAPALRQGGVRFEVSELEAVAPALRQGGGSDGSDTIE
ncbi:MAG TPA: hypothetical protein VIS95_02995 [Solirubrobacterales bacterium]